MADEVTLPTEEEIYQLPCWAQVAFAVRCARRALPLFNKNWPDAPKQHSDAIVKAIEFAEQSARDEVPRRDPRAPRDDDDDAVEDASDAAEAAGVASAAAAANAVIFASSVHTAAYAAEAAWKAGVPFSDIRKDFTKLQNESILHQWTDDSPVPSTVFDSLDEPTHAFILELHSEPGIDPNLIGDAVIKLWEVANEYHMAMGGGVLTLDEFQQFMPALVPVAPTVGG